MFPKANFEVAAGPERRHHRSPPPNYSVKLARLRSGEPLGQTPASRRHVDLGRAAYAVPLGAKDQRVESVNSENVAKMAKRAWTTHWQIRFWTPAVNDEGAPIVTAGSNVFRQRGVAIGDSVYVVSMKAGELYLGGRMTVEGIVSREEAIRLTGCENLFDASEWIVTSEEGGTPLNLHRKVEAALARKLSFESKQGPKPYHFVSEAHLDKQTTRGVRELTAESARLLDRIIAFSDGRPRKRGVVTVKASDVGA